VGASQPVELWCRPIGAAGRPSPSVATFPLRLTVFNPQCFDRRFKATCMCARVMNLLGVHRLSFLQNVEPYSFPEASEDLPSWPVDKLSDFLTT
jgi:hypothetical protein